MDSSEATPPQAIWFESPSLSQGSWLGDSTIHIYSIFVSFAPLIHFGTVHQCKCKQLTHFNFEFALMLRDPGAGDESTVEDQAFFAR